MKIKFTKFLMVFSQAAACLLTSACSTNETKKVEKQIYADDNEDISLNDAITITADFTTPSDPALIKKMDMYNAGCVNPVTNYGRDMEYSKLLNPNSLRIDASIGKDNGNAGEFLVTDEYDIYDYDPVADTYKIDPSSLHYDFSALDETLSYFQEMETLPYISWCYLPTPLQDTSNFTRLETRVTNWQEVWEEIYYNYAKYYKDKGVRIGFHEIYNEPDLEILKYWGVFPEDSMYFLNIDSFAPLQADGSRDPSKGCYPDMYEYGIKGILRADPDATVGGPAFALGDIAVEDWVGFMPRVKERNLQMDFFSFHTYLDGETWFLPQSKRNKGRKNELEKVVDSLESSSQFLTTAVHINEFSPVNSDNGSLAGDNCDFNYYYGAGMSLDALFEAVDRSSIQKINWAQMNSCSASNNDPYGLIDRYGYPKAALGALMLYQDMPVWRYKAESNHDDSGLRTVVSTDDDKISILIWNTNDARDASGVLSTDGDRTAAVKLDSPRFQGGTRRVYRIDKEHASHYDQTLTDLPSYQNEKKLNGEEEYVWTGNVPADGVVYITINKDEINDFEVNNYNDDFANVIKTSYYYEDRYRGLTGSREEYSDFTSGKSGSYALFDDHTWTTYLGLGPCEGKSDGSAKNQAVASTGVICDDLPTNFRVLVDKDTRCKMLNQYSNLSVRIDFYNDATGEYEDSVALHNGIYDISANPNEQDSKLTNVDVYPWGTKTYADKEVAFTGNTWNVNLNEIAPEYWLNGSHKAMVSYTLRNTGANSRVMITLAK